MDAEFVVAVAFFLFVAILVWQGVHKKLVAALDHRTNRIINELGEAQRLRVEAEKLMAEFRKKHESAEIEAAQIVEDAKAEAERIGSEAKAKVEDYITRRTAQAELKIAQAEASAMSEVRSAASDAAVRAAAIILKGQMSGKAGADLFAAGVADVKSKLN
jgi:F-type H+-transporting ATPase subunit b